MTILPNIRSLDPGSCDKGFRHSTTCLPCGNLEKLSETNGIDDIEKVIFSLKLTTFMFTPEDGLGKTIRLHFGALFAYSFRNMFAVSFWKILQGGPLRSL